MQGYCVRCKAKQEMLSATRTYAKNGRRAMLGICGCCGTKMSLIGVWDADPPAPVSEAPAPHAYRAAASGQPARAV